MFGIRRSSVFWRVCEESSIEPTGLAWATNSDPVALARLEFGVVWLFSNAIAKMHENFQKGKNTCEYALNSDTSNLTF